MKSFLFPVSIMVVFAVVGVFAVNPFHSSLANDTCGHGLFYDLYQNRAQELTKIFSNNSKKEETGTHVVGAFLGQTFSQKQLVVGPNDISGKVWEDWNFNGTMDEVTTKGIAGVEVQLFDCQGNIVGSTVSDADGDFLLDNGNTTFGGNANEVYRLEFIVPSYISAWAKPTQSGTENGTSVQFLQKGDTAYLGLAAPADFCQNNPNLVTNCFIEGDNSGIGDVLLSYSSQSPVAFNHESVANQIGTTYGLAYQRASNHLFASAYMKRFAGLVGSTGSIFKISNPDDGVISGEEFVDLNDLFGSDIAGTDPHNFVDVTLFGDVIDSASYSAVGKMSFGDLDISGDERSLWTINLFDRSLYHIPLGNDPADPTPPNSSSAVTIVPLTDGDIALPNPLPDLPAGVTDNEIRPFALEIKNNLVYVGLVTSGEDGGSMSGLVYAYNPDNQIFTKVLEFPLGYDRGCGLANTSLCIGPADWNAWTDIYPTNPAMNAGAEHAHPQPILSDIEFDANGNMVIGLRDRFGDQTGYKVPLPNGNFNLRTGDGFGDILLATLNGVNSWTLDTTQFADHTYSIHANGTTETELFFGGDYYIGANDLHEETASGGLVILPGQNVVISTVIDPIASFSAGVDWFNTNTGAQFFTLELLDRFEQFSKANGLGEMEVICDPAPIEIGNLVWEDLDGDGIQDACEPGLSGVNVHLYDRFGNLLASTMTDGYGQYYFSHSDSTDQVWISSPDSVEANSIYYVVVGTGQFSNGQLNYNGDDYSLTVDSTNSGANRFAIDSDGTIAEYISNDINGLPYVKVTTSDWGVSDHSLDFGFYDCLPEVMEMDEIICEGSTYFFNGQNLATSGTYYDSLLTVDGCDSVFILNLVVQSVTDVQLMEEICPGESYPFFGNNLTTTGIYRDTQFYTTGCDSIRTTLDLTALADCSPPAFDLALRKKLAPTQSRYVQIGEYVKFRIYVFNQGDFDAFNVLVVDYQPIGFDFVLSQSPGWFNFGAGPTWFLPSLPAGEVDSIDITFLVNPNAADVELGNYAEITAADDDLNPSNQDPDDVDSTPNGLFYDDPGGTPGTPADDVITGDGTGILGSNDPLTDEDDHDGEEVILTAPILSLGNLVFEDFDNDGIFNNSDLGVEDVVVELYEAGLDGVKNTADDVFIASALTNGFGEYLFTGLVDGMYYVKLTGVGIPVGHRSSTGGGPFDNDGSGNVEPAASPDDDVDDVDDGTQMITMIVSGLIQLSLNDEPDGNQNLTLDFGIYSPEPESLGLGNLVFNDKNNDGIFNNNDEGIEDVEVKLFDLGTDGTKGTADDNLIAMTVTNGFGEYQFSGLPEGTYYVQLTGVGIPAGFVSSTGDGVTDMDGMGFYEPATGTDNNEDGTDDGTQIGAAIASDIIVMIFDTEINDGDNNSYNNPSVDFGLYLPEAAPTVSVGDLVFWDKENNGVYDGSDEGLENVEVVLYSPGTDGLVGTPDDLPLKTTMTNGFGQYLFDTLSEGSYFIKLSGIGISLGYISSTGDGIYDSDTLGFYDPAPNANGNTDNVDDGTQMGDMILSSVFQLTLGDETGDGDSNPDYNQSLDFGLYEPQEPPVFDLALRKTLAIGQSELVNIGDVVTFTVTIFNQGTAPAYNILVLDYLPIGFTFNAAGSPGWFNFGAGPTWFYAGPLLPGQADSLNIQMTVNSMALPGMLNNYAEITSADNNTNGSDSPPTDIDSSPDAFLGNDAGGTPGLPADNALDGDGTGSSNSNNPLTDEDDMDGAEVYLDVPTMTLGNLVFADYENDGVFNNSDEGINDVRLELYEVGNDGEKGTGDDEYVDFSVTDSTGKYLFQIYSEGLYFVKLTGDGIPTNYVSSTGEGVNDPQPDGPFEPATGTDNNIDNTDDGSQMGAMVMSDTIRMTFGNEPSGAENNDNLTVDFGLYEPIIFEILDLGNLVFHDENNDGVFNNSEPGLEAVEVKLFEVGPDGEQGTVDDVELATTQTDASGIYQFSGIDPGLYYVKLTGVGIPVDMVSSTGEGIYDNDGAGPFEPSLGTNNDLNNLDDGTQMGAMILSDTIRLTFGGEPDFDVNNTVDFGLFAPTPEPTMTLGNLVFADVQNNGFFNGADYGLADVEVQLMILGPDEIKGTNDDELLLSTTTNGSGEYQFSGIPQGLYYVKLSGFGVPANWVSSTGQGIYDNDGAGPFEPSIGTNNNFNNVDDGTQMGDMIMSDTIRLTWFQEPQIHVNNTVDFGLYEPRVIQLGNFVFNDLDNDGIFNNSDQGIEDVGVALMTLGPDGEKGTNDDVQLSTQMTNGFGEYLFTGLVEGLFYVKLTGVGIPTGYVSSTGDGVYDMDGAGAYEPSLGTDDNVDGIDDGTQMGSMIMGDTIRLTLDGEPDRDANYTVDFGLYFPQDEPTFSLGNLVFHDLDNDGVFNNSDVGLQNVEVVLFDVGLDGEKGTADDVEIATKTTNAAGEYLFTGFYEGLYYVQLSGTGIPTNFVSSTGDGIYDMDGAGPFEPSLGTDNNTDHIDDGSQMGVAIMSDTIRLTIGSEPGGEVNTTVDFGLYEPQIANILSLGNLVFHDQDNDGLFNHTDEGIENVEVILFEVGADGEKGTMDDLEIDTKTTNIVGEYLFENLIEGLYYVKLSGAGIPANLISSTGDGIYDMDSDGPFEPSLGTDGNGDDLDDGTQMSGMVMSDTIRLTLYSEPNGNENLTVDFGLYVPQPIPTVSVGNLVFTDYDNDGVFNNIDMGTEGVEVELYDLGADGIKGTNDDNLVGTDTTNNFGEYQFLGLDEGVYYLKLNGTGIPANYVSSTGDGPYDMDGAGPFEPSLGTDNNVDGIDDGTQMGAMIMSDTIRLTLGNEPDGDFNNTVDFGLYEPQIQPSLSLGNLVFEDFDNDGLFNNSDVGLAGVEVILINVGPDNTKGTTDDFNVDTLLTNGAGQYLFTNIYDPGVFCVKLTGNGIPTGYLSSTGDGPYDADMAGAYEPFTGTNNNVDNDDDGTAIMANMILSDTIRLSFGDEPDVDINTTVDFGLYHPQTPPIMSLGNLVFHDKNNDGLFNQNDAGLQGVEVALYQLGTDGIKGTADDALIATENTNSLGGYLFTNLFEGLYFVKLTGVGVPIGYISSTGDGPFDMDGLGAFEPSFGTDNNIDEDDDGTQMSAMVLSDTIRLVIGDEPAGNVNTTVDFGLYEPQELSLGNMVFHDLDNDGVFNNLDTGLAGIEVKLFDLGLDSIIGNNDDNELATLFTNNNGEYVFTGLENGVYYVKLTGVGIASGFESSSGEGPYDLDSMGAFEPTSGTDNNVDGIDDGTQMGAMILSDTIRLTLQNEPNGNNNFTVDFGLFAPHTPPVMQLGSTVFHDLNNDGLFALPDTGLANVKVELYDLGTDDQKGTADDHLIASQTTNNIGAYLFEDLFEGLYYVKLSGEGIPTNFVSSTGEGIYDQDGAGPYEPYFGTDNDIDMEDDGTQMGTMIMSDTIRLVYLNEPFGNINLTVDFGLYEPQDEPTNSLGNLVFNDFENDGIFNNNDIGLQGVEVELYGVGTDGLQGTGDDILVDTKLTDNNGEYLFTGLPQGLYFIKLTGNGIPANHVSSTGEGIFDQDGSGPFEPITGADNNVDNLDDGSQMGAMILSDTIRLTWFQEPDVHVNTTVDFGLYEPQDVPTLSLGNLVFDDRDNDGIFNNNDVGLADVEVKLFDVGPDSLGNTMDDIELATKLTSGQGTYLFTGLSEGLYFVKLSGAGIPTGYVSSTGDGAFDQDGSGPFEPIFGTDNNVDHQDDGTLIGGMIQSDTIRLVLDAEPDVNVNTTVDFGLYMPLEYASVGDQVWVDADRDGQQGANPTGISGVFLELMDLGTDGIKGTADDNLIDVQETDGTGNYSFTGLVPGDYYIVINLTTVPTDHELTVQDQGADATDSDFNAMGMTEVFTLGSGENNTSIDAGIVPKPSSIGNFVWFDNDHNGQQDIGEPGIPQLPVQLFDLGLDGMKGGGDDNLISTIISDDNGFYLFDGLEAGSYYVQFDISAYATTYTATPQDIGDDATDSDGNAIGMTDVIVLAIGEENLTIDFGLEPELAMLGDYVWFDTNHNGQQDASETGVPDFHISIFNLGIDGIKNTGDDMLVGEMMTLADGSYSFQFLQPGSYYLIFDVNPYVGMYSAAPQNIGNDATDSDGNGGGMTDVIILDPAEVNNTIDFGLEPDHAMLGDFVWYDDNVNGQQDMGEVGVPNVLVRLFNLGADGQKGGGDDLEFNSVLTDSTGYYLFNFLEPDDYYLQFEIGSLPTDYFPTTPNSGDDTTDSDANQMGMTEVVTLGPGENNSSVDMGVYNPMFDLSLTKSLAPGQSNMVDINQTIHYQITVKNEGLTAAYNVLVADHIPAGLLFSPINLSWNLVNDSTATYNITGPILPNDEVVLDIYLTVQYGASGASLVNVAEVESATDVNGVVVNDIDSTPANENPTEDDIDGEEIVLLDHDPTGWIYCEKTGQVITGGTITVIGPSGIPNADVQLIADGSAGYYEFFAVGATGTYTIQFTHPSGFPFSVDCPPGGVFNPVNGGPAVTLGSLASNGHLLDTACVANPYYFQFDLELGDPPIFANNIPVQCSYISSIVCEDSNNNDMVDPADQRIVGATVNLYDCNDPNNILATSITDANGRYEFDGLTPGNYMVGYQLPVGTRFVSNGTMNTNGFSNCVSLNWGECDTSKVICLYTCPAVTADDQTICFGGMAQLLATVPYGNGSFNWLPPNDLSATNIPNPVASPADTTTYMVTYMDGLGCLMSDDATVFVLNTSPYLTYTPFDSISVECDQPVPFEAPIFADDCDTNLVVTLDSMVLMPGCGLTIERTWTATNAQGNATTFTQIVNVVDNTPPVMMASHPLFGNIFHGDTLYADCTNISSLDSLGFSAFDYCCATTVNFEETVTVGDCDIDGFVESRYCGWTASDCCGNTDSLYFTIIIQDINGPVLTGVPADVTVDCGNVPAIATVTADDACGGATPVLFVETAIGDTTSGCFYLLRTWTATDSCGNTTSDSQGILVQDFVPPVLFNVPPSGVADCENIPDVVVTATDNCDGDIPVTLTETLTTDSNGCVVLVERRWTAIDGCGNLSFATQMLVVENDDAPELTVTHPMFVGRQHGDTIYVQCDQVAVLTANDVTATADCCGAPTIEFHEYVSNGDCLEDGYLASMTCGWTASDCCGNIDSLFLHIIVIDNTPPVLKNVPADMMYQCVGTLPAPPNVTATDNCDDNPQVTFSESTVFVNSAPQTTRTWTATDACGNTTTQSQLISYTQENAPFILNVPADITVPTTADVPPPSANVMADDDCDPDPLLSVVDVPSGSGCCYFITRTWTATDNYGLTAVDSQIITVRDFQAPVITGVPPDLVVQCEYVEMGIAPVTISDNCTANPILNFTQDTTFNTCYYEINRRWTAIDECGNITFDTQTITVTDTEPPTTYAYHSQFGEIQDGDVLFASCTQIASLDSIGFATTDNCSGDITRTFEENVTSGSCVVDGFIEMRYCGWTVTDACGNSNQLFFTVLISDYEAPVLSGVPADVTVDCNSVPPNNAPVTVTDNCGIDLPIFMTEDTVSYTCPDTYTLERKWMVSDSCGNAAMATQIITVIDDTPPTTFATHAFFGEIKHGDTIYATCSQIPSLDSIGFASDDFCSSVTRTFEETVTRGNCLVDGFVESRYCGWTVTDECGNRDSLFFTVIIQDVEPPVLYGVPADITVACDSVPPNDAVVTATDNCYSEVYLTASIDTIQGTCTGSYLLHRNWTATDSCGNTTVGTQVVTVVNETPPTLYAYHNFFGQIFHGDTLFAECTQIPSLDSLGFDAVDDCCETTRTFEETVVVGDCDVDGFIEKRYCGWTATDCCGNTDSLYFTVFVIDTIGPIITGVPSDTTVICGNVPVLVDVDVTDNCTANPFYYPIETINRLDCPFTVTRVWIATDDCGNVTTDTQLIFVVEEFILDFEFVNPALQGLSDGDTLVLDCSSPDVFYLDDAVATTNCDSLEFTFEEDQVAFGDCETDGFIAILSNTWTASDPCGNDTSVTIYIQYVDSQPPVFTFVPADTIITCGDEIPAFGTPEASDACGDVELFFKDYEEPTPYGSYRVRDWTAVDECGNRSFFSQTIQVIDGIVPVLESISISPEICDNENGAAEILVEGDESAYVYNWSPNLGTPTNAIGNARTGLPAGDYQVIVVDGFCNDTFDFTVLMECDCEPAIVTRLDLVNATCGENDGSAIIELQQDVTNYSFLWIPNLGTPTANNSGRLNLVAGHYVVIMVHDGDNTCVATVEFDIYDDCGRCGPMLAETALVAEVSANETTFCLPIPFGVAIGKDIQVNGQLYTGAFEACDPQSVVAYDYSLVPGMAQTGPFSVLWEHEGTLFSTVINNMDELAGGMSQVDSLGTWQNDKKAFQLITTNLSGNYGEMYIYTIPTEEHTFLGAEDGMADLGTTLELSAGVYDVTFTNPLNDCNETLQLILEEEEQEELMLFLEDTLMLSVPCNNGVFDFCLDVPLGELDDYAFLLNDNPVNDQLVACEYEVTTYYSYQSLSSLTPPFSLDQWEVNGQIFSGTFNTIDELVDLMVQVDPTGNWTNDSAEFQISGGNDSSNYGHLACRNIATSATFNLAPNIFNLVTQFGLALEPGIHQLSAKYLASEATDELVIFLACVDTDEVSLDLPIGATDTICLDVSGLPGELNDVIEICDGGSTTSAIIEFLPGTFCLEVDALSIGTSETCLVVCDEYGFCDTTYLTVNVGPANPTPTIEESTDLVSVNNYLTPDGDGINDYFTIRGIENLYNYQLTIVDQLGRIVYRSDNYKNDWNGAYSNGQVMNGVYFYVLEMEDGQRLSGPVVVVGI